MCGNGSRTQELGEYKPFIKIFDKFIFEWNILSIKNNINNDDELYFIITKSHQDKFNVDQTITNVLNKYLKKIKYKFVILKKTPAGPAKSVYSCKEYIKNKNNIIVINHDQFISFNLPENRNFMTVYFDTSDSKSYCNINNDIITSVVEKKRISNHASSGVYGFENGNDLIFALEELFKHPEIMIKNEFYIGMCINFLIEKKKIFIPITTKCKYDLGTVQNINFFKSTFINICEEKKNLFISMSGGTTTVINATLAGVLTKIKNINLFDKIFIGNNYSGILGLVNNDLKILDLPTYDELLDIKVLPGSGYIGTTRIHKLNDDDFNNIKNTIYKNNINCIINIGGSGTYKQTCSIAQKFSNLNIIFLPKTVDNDIGDSSFEKLYYTPGFPSCVKYWHHKMEIYNQENLGAHQHDKVLVTQTFGRDTGFIAGCVRLFDKERKLPLLILLPEDQKPIKEVLEAIKEKIKIYRRCIVVMSEGYKIGDIGESHDKSGQIMYGSSNTTAAQLLVTECIKNNIQARSNIPSFDQRMENLLTCKNDINLSFNIGFESINYLIEKKFKHFYVGIDKKKILFLIN